jgi:ABC-type dipeptide/oligopeptide/nickel transport system permease subunit
LLVKAKLPAALDGVRALLVIFACIVVIAPDVVSRISSRRTEGFLAPSWYQASPDGAWYALGTDYLGRAFVPVLCQAASATMRIALLGTAAVVLGCLFIGVIHGSTRSRGLEALVATGNLGVMAVPEAAVLITLATAWPRTSSALYVNASMLAVLITFAIPTGSRLIAERVRAVGRTGFVAASRAYGATYPYTFRHDIWPHLHEDLAWIVASVLPRFVAVEVGMAYLGVEYRDFEGLGRLLTKSFNNLSVGTAVFQMLVTILVILWVALLPQLILRSLGARAAREAAR